MRYQYDKKWQNIIGISALSCFIIAIILWHVYWNVSESTFEMIFKIASIAFVIYGFFYPLRALFIVISRKFVPTLKHEVITVILFVSGIIVGLTCSLPIIITYIICNILGLVTSPK
jgi:hypothetical protein